MLRQNDVVCSNSDHCAIASQPAGLLRSVKPVHVSSGNPGGIVQKEQISRAPDNLVYSRYT